jgi:prevent-host-death family protein
VATEKQRSERLPLPAKDETWDDRLDRVRRNGGPVVIEEHGRAVAALVSLQDYRRLLRSDAARRRLFASIDRMQDAFADVPLDEIEREITRTVEHVRRMDRSHAGPSSTS